MKDAAVICEYNPFHLGHAYQLARARETCGGAVVCLMSGNFVQRGTPALFPARVRAAAAVSGGADLVLELPVTVALRSAEGFADGAVEILTALGVAQTLCFGSECGDAAALLETARMLRSNEFPAALRRELDTGVSFAAARCRAAAALGADGQLLARPNDILGVEYCKALLRRGMPMEPLTIRRVGEYHSTSGGALPSATAVRAAFPDGGWAAMVPEAAAARYRAAEEHRLSFGERAVLARLRAMPDAEFENLPGGGEGLWSAFRTACRTQCSTEQILNAVKSKRYARTRLQRMLLCAYLGLDAAALAQPVPYVRALAFNDRGRAVLRGLRGGMLPIVSGGPGPDAEYFALEIRCAGLYALFSAPGQEPPPGRASFAGVDYLK